MQQHAVVRATGNGFAQSTYAATVRRCLTQVADEYETLQLDCMTFQMENQRLRTQLANLAKSGDTGRASPSKMEKSRASTTINTDLVEAERQESGGSTGARKNVHGAHSYLQYSPRSVSWESPEAKDAGIGDILNEYADLPMGSVRPRPPLLQSTKTDASESYDMYSSPICKNGHSDEGTLVLQSSEDSNAIVPLKAGPKTRHRPFTLDSRDEDARSSSQSKEQLEVGDKVRVVKESRLKGATAVIINTDWNGMVKVSMDEDDAKGRIKSFKFTDIEPIDNHQAIAKPHNRRAGYGGIITSRYSWHHGRTTPGNRRRSNADEALRSAPSEKFIQQGTTRSNPSRTSSRLDVNNYEDSEDEHPPESHIKFEAKEDRIEIPTANSALFSSEGSSTTKDGGSLFPRWFDPGEFDEDEASLEASEEASRCNSQGSDSSKERNADASARRETRVFRRWNDQKEDACVLSPVGRPRLAWDMFAVVCLLTEAWSIPFDLIFLDHIGTPAAFYVISYCITCFFAVDICLNFMTGYIDGDHSIMNRRDIFHHYMKLWFWIDLLATIPWDLLLSLVGGGIFSFTRVGKASRFVRTLRYIKFLRAARLIKSMQRTGEVARHFSYLEALRMLAQPLKALGFLICYAHVHGCLWAAFQPSEFRILLTMRDAIYRYFECFHFAFLAVTCGFPKPLGVVIDGWQWSLEMLIALERLFVIILAGNRVVYNSLKLIDDAREDHTNNHILTYLRRNYVSLQKQVEVSYSLRDIREARKKQHFFDELIEEDLPRELRREVTDELFRKRLLSLGLIAQVSLWHKEFIVELAQIVREETYPSRSILLEVGHPATVAHCILHGELIVTRSPGIGFIPNFTKGMWVGENSLVSATLRNSATIVARVITSVMTIRGDGFQNLVSALHLMHKYQEFCTDHLWRGLCGRCGMLGDHFSDGCHMTKKSTFRRISTLLGAQISKSPTEVSSEAGIRRSMTSHMSGVSKATGDAVCSQNSIEVSGSGDRDEPVLAVQRMGSMDSSFGGRNSPRRTRRFLDFGNMLNVGFMSTTREEAPMYSPRRSLQESFDKSAWKELRKFLADHSLLSLTAVLLDLHVYSLLDLEAFDMDVVVERLKEQGEVLTAQQQELFSSTYVVGWRARKKAKAHTALFREVSRLHHLIFLSHYKMEAGTEAALMRTELEFAISESPGSIGQHFDEPVFLDSENLSNLEDLTRRVRNTHNLVILLTKNVLTRPWCLLEIITARREGLRILLVNVSKPGNEFIYPDEAFYEKLTSGKYLDKSATDLLLGLGCTLDELSKAIRSMFQNIAVPYSPHKAMSIRKAEVAALLKMCKLKGEEKDGKRSQT